MRARPLRVGTRASQLALWQTERVRAALHAAGHATERIEITTTGDVILDTPLAKIGSRALFTKQLDDAMLEDRIDIAVHSLKDLPTTLPDGIALGAVGQREDPRDALVGRGPVTFEALPPGATVATSSLRRRAQLLHRRPDLDVVDIRGNVDTRLAKLDRNAGWSAIMLAAAGLVRLGFGDRIGERLPFALMLPAPGQGALAATCRPGDATAEAALRAVLHDDATARAVAAERGFLHRLEGGCQVPVAAHATVQGESLTLLGRVIGLGGDRLAAGERTARARDVQEAAALGGALAERLLGEGADAILAEVRAAGAGPVATES
ncbi:MAG: hydroxymethylbilane synthase [Gemmatimonadales bacterium]|nr:hydroxymethylbilane synthase [Gemmatimonadales bacterium]